MDPTKDIDANPGDSKAVLNNVTFHDESGDTVTPRSEIRKSGLTPMVIRPCTISDCFVIDLPTLEDDRGAFTKNFCEEKFRANGLETVFPEEFFTRSVRGVIRGIHFTVPPIDQVKVVTCVHGTILDLVIDLRIGSPTYGRHFCLELGASKPTSLYIGRGLGHAFLVLSQESILLYRVSTKYDPRFDSGIRFDSVGFGWPMQDPIISDRDRSLPRFVDFESPFKF